MIYDAEYYQSINYSNYLHRQDRYNKTANEIVNFLKSIGLPESDREKNILDYGCGVGFLVNSFENNMFPAYGYDVSSWAIEYGKHKLYISGISNNFKICTSRNYFLTTALDVFEHVTIPYLDTILRGIQTKYLLVRIPVSKEVDGEFILESANRDKTHVTRLPKRVWNEIFKSNDYKPICKLNLQTVYDSEGVFCALYRNTLYRMYSDLYE